MLRHADALPWLCVFAGLLITAFCFWMDARSRRRSRPYRGTNYLIQAQVAEEWSEELDECFEGPLNFWSR